MTTDCPTCGRPLLKQLAELKCHGCGRRIGGDDAHMVKQKGICTPFHIICTPSQATM